jgi:hypothetical protein
MWLLIIIGVCWYVMAANSAKKTPEQTPQQATPKTNGIGKTIGTVAGTAIVTWLERKAGKK